MTEIEEKANENNCSSVIIAGDIHFESIEWIGLVSSDNYESSILNKLADQNFTQILNSTNRKQLDVFLTNKPELVINSGKENQFNKNFKSDHQASIISLQIENEVKADMKIENFAFNKVDWKTLNEAIVNDPFMPYCFSNVDELLKQWYTWCCKILTKTIPKITNTDQQIEFTTLD